MQFCFKMIKGKPCFFYSRSKDLTWKNKQQTSEIEIFKKNPDLEKFFNELGFKLMAQSETILSKYYYYTNKHNYLFIVAQVHKEIKPLAIKYIDKEEIERLTYEKDNIRHFYILFEPNIKVNQKEVKK